MSDFLNSVKADLTDRRLRPVVAVAVLALVGALGYALLGGGGGSSATPTASAVAPAVSAPVGLAASEATHNTAVAETTEGESTQHRGITHNPFALLPQATVVVKTGPSTASSSTSSSSAGAEGKASTETKSSGETKPAQSTKPAAVKPKTVYHVAVLFGLTPPAPPAPSSPLTPYLNIKLMTALPNAKAPLLIFRGVTAGGKSATFTLVSEAILHGPAACLPSASQCEAIDLAAGQTEQLEYISAEGLLVNYELTVSTIEPVKATSSAVKDLFGKGSKAGRELLRHAGLVTIPGLNVSSQAGVYVFAPHIASAARAHVALAARPQAALRRRAAG